MFYRRPYLSGIYQYSSINCHSPAFPAGTKESVMVSCLYIGGSAKKSLTTYVSGRLTDFWTVAGALHGSGQ